MTFERHGIVTAVSGPLAAGLLSNFTGITNRLLDCSADMPRDSPLQASLGRVPDREAVELIVMQSEHHKLPVLRAACCVGPNAAIATVKVDHGKISERRRCYAEANSQYAKRKSQSLHYCLPYASTDRLCPHALREL